jgi:hypothetical protein
MDFPTIKTDLDEIMFWAIEYTDQSGMFKGGPWPGLVELDEDSFDEDSYTLWDSKDEAEEDLYWVGNWFEEKAKSKEIEIWRAIIAEEGELNTEHLGECWAFNKVGAEEFAASNLGRKNLNIVHGKTTSDNIDWRKSIERLLINNTNYNKDTAKDLDDDWPFGNGQENELVVINDDIIEIIDIERED